MMTKDIQFSISKMFLLPYVKIEAQVMFCMLSPPSIRNHVKYDPIVKALLDNEAVKWGRSCLLNLKVDHWVPKPFMWSYGWVESSNTIFYYPLGIQSIQYLPSYCMSRWRHHHSILVTFLMDELHLDILSSFLLTLVGKIIHCTHKLLLSPLITFPINFL